VSSYNSDIAVCEAALLALDRVAVMRLMASEGGGSTLSRIENVMIPALERIGTAWEEGAIALAQVYMGGRICEEVVDRLCGSDGTVRPTQPRIALAVLEDFHLLGKRMVYATMRGAGYVVKDYWRTDVATLIRRTVQDDIDLLLVSTLMLPSALRISAVRDGLNRAGCRARIIVGGAPFRFDDSLWRDVGADAMCRNASDLPGMIPAFSGGRS